MYFDRESIIAAQQAAKLPVETVEAFGGEVCIQKLDAAGYLAAIAEDSSDQVGAMIRLVIRSVVHPETRHAIFTSDDVETLKGFDGKDILKIVTAANRLNNWGKLEEVAKNS